MLPAENTSVTPTFFTQRWSCQRLPQELREQLVTFASSTAPASDAAAYLAPRWTTYAELEVARDRRGIQAFALIHPFVTAGERHLYVGPMFSRGGAYVELFAQMVQTLLFAPSRRPFHVAAEIEHPSVLRSFSILFPSYVAQEAHPTSGGNRRIAARFARQVPHIAGLELDTLRTDIAAPLFRTTRDAPTSAQLVLVSWHGDAESRRYLQHQLTAGLTVLRRS